MIVTFPEFLAGKRSPDLYAIDMVVIRQACALIDLVRHDSPTDQFEHMAAWVRSDPDHVATLAIVLAAVAAEDAVEPARVLELLSRYPVDLELVSKQAHVLYVKYAKSKQQDALPGWVWAGKRIYDRIKARRARERATTTNGGA